jgi:hypothetical protein
LNPKKAKDFIPEIATKLGVKEEMVEDLINFVFSQQKKKMSSLQHLQVCIPYLGLFRLSYKKLKEFSEKHKNVAGKQVKTIKGLKFKEDALLKKEKVDEAIARWKKEYKRMNQVKKKRDEFKKNI